MTQQHGASQTLVDAHGKPLVQPMAKPVVVHTDPANMLERAARLMLEHEARRLHPTDLYAQTCVVMGYDPLPQ